MQIILQKRIKMVKFIYNKYLQFKNTFILYLKEEWMYIANVVVSQIPEQERLVTIRSVGIFGKTGYVLRKRVTR